MTLQQASQIELELQNIVSGSGFWFWSTIKLFQKNMNYKFLKDALGWGFVLWLIGYILGIVLFMLVPTAIIGWIITPIGITIILWVLYKKIHSEKLNYFLKLGIIWTVIAVILDYIFIVIMFAPEDGYYKLDVYLYYFFTLTLPLLAGWMKTGRKK